MTPHKFLTAIQMLLISTTLIHVGCTASSSVSTTPAENLSDISTVPASRTSLPITALPAAQIPSATPSLTPTTAITLTPILTIEPTATEIPFVISTPPGIDATEQILWLFETNNGCQLPCWWGITPGETEWQNAEEFFHRFDKDIYEASSTPGLIYYGVSIPLAREVFFVNYTELGVSVKNGFVEGFETEVPVGEAPPGSLRQYMLSSFLTTYGPPTEVWLSTHSTPPGGGPGSNILPFVIVLFYSDQGIAAIYDDLGEIVSDKVRGCPQAYPVSTLDLWSPSSDFTFEELVNGSSAFNREYLSLEEATELDVGAFYETFKNPENTSCLETPANLWR